MSFHSLAFRAFCQATEDESNVRKALSFAAGVEEIDTHASEGYHGNRILILTASIRNRKGIELFFKRLDEEDLRRLLDSLERRVDEDGNLFLRLDKQRAFMEELALSDDEGDDVISVRGNIKAYPKSRDRALSVASDFLNSVTSTGTRE